MAKKRVTKLLSDKNRDEQDKAAQRARENQQVVIYMFVSLMIILAWIIGCCQGSFLWVCLLILLTFVVWCTKVISLIEAHVRDKELQIHRKRALRKSETAEWINFLVNRWWIFSSGTISDIIKRKLDPLLSDVKPSFLKSIELASFTLGEKTPFIKYIHAYEYVDVGLGGKKLMSWSSVVQSVSGLQRAQQHQIIIEVDVGLVGEDFQMVFKATMGGKRLGMPVDLAVEKLNISGKMQIIVHLDMDMTFPHVSAVTLSFVEKPQIWFSVRALKVLPMTDIPGLKSWIHWLVMDALTEAVVDPGKMNINFDLTGPSCIPAERSAKCNAQGVITVTIKGEEIASGMLLEDVHYCELNIDDQCKQTKHVRSPGSWQDTSSFLVYDLSKDKLCVKCLMKILLTTHTQAEFVVALADFPFECTPVCHATLEDTCPNRGTPVSIQLEMEYTALTPISTMIDTTPESVSEVSGVMYVCVHGARNLLGLDADGFSDPYCVLYSNGKKIASTHYIKHTKNPDWDFSTEFIVADFTRTMLSFIICDWDGHSANEDDLLGSTHAVLTKDEPVLIRTQLMLGYNTISQSDGARLGSVIVSVIFRPVPSVAKSETITDATSTLDDIKPAKKKTLMPDYSITDILGYCLLELHVMRAKNLVAKDINGFSDPYVVISVNGDRKYKSHVKKKTLDPVWDEHVTIPLPGQDDILEVAVWDKDPLFLKDFLGSLTFTLDDLKKYNNNNQHDGWFVLNRVEKGELQLKISFPLDDASAETVQKPQMVDVGTSMSLVSSSPDSGLPSSTPVTPRHLNNSFAFQNQERGSETVNSIDSHLTNATSRNRSLSFPGSASAENPDDKSLGVVEQSTDSAVGNNIRQKPSHSRSTSAPSAKGLPKLRAPMTNQSRNFSGLRSKGWRQSLRPTTSLDPMVLNDAPPEFYYVQGEIHRIKGLQVREQEIYIKLRLDKRHLGRAGSLAVIAKSPKIKATPDTLIKWRFNVDSGIGVPKEALLIFDVKKSRKSHIATQSYTLQEIFGESETVTKWLALDDSIALEVGMHHTLIPLPETHKLRPTFSSFRASSRSSHT